MKKARFAMLVAGCLVVGHAEAEDLSARDLVCKLDPACPRPPGFRKLDVTGTSNPEPPLSVNLYINFDYDSANLQSDSMITLDKLGNALTDPKLSAFVFLIAGHTDARGGEDYNQRLSERRAQAVKDYLARKFGISPGRLSIRGFGKSQLLDPSRPEDGVNRRVQITNTMTAIGSR